MSAIFNKIKEEIWEMILRDYEPITYLGQEVFKIRVGNRSEVFPVFQIKAKLDAAKNFNDISYIWRDLDGVMDMDEWLSDCETFWNFIHYQESGHDMSTREMDIKLAEIEKKLGGDTELGGALGL